MDASQLLFHRLEAQHIQGSRLQTPEAVVSWLGAMQAQEFHHVKWALGVRLPGMVEADVDQAILNRKIARTWALRGTLHIVAAEDLRWMVALSSAANQAKTRPLHKKLELGPQDLDKAVAAICNALEGGKALERKDLFAAIETAGISTESMRGAFLLYEAAHRGFICLGPTHGKQDTYILVEEWLPATKTLDRPSAIVELTRRYFQSHGPATLQDFVWWSGLTVREARMGLEAMAPDLDKLVVAHVEHWMGRNFENEALPTVLLLPGFDEYLIAYKDRTTMLDPAHFAAVISSNGIFRPIVVMQGKIVGTWRRGSKGKATVELEGFGAPLPVTEALRAQMDAYLRFVAQD